MPIEKLIIYIALAAFFFVKFVADTLKRQREIQPTERASESEVQEHSEHWWEPLVEPVQQQARLEPEARSGGVPLPRAPVPLVRPAKKEHAARARRQATVQPALQQHRMALGNRAELRRTFELMAILGPPRSLAPYDA